LTARTKQIRREPLERPAVVQKIIAALAESANFVDKNRQLAMAAVGKTCASKIRIRYARPKRRIKKVDPIGA
jgi:ABC-type nitrate/sulfonate/bicarbonate transport system substrate-binding protein